MKLMSEKQIENMILSWLAMNRVKAWKNESTGVFDQKIGRFRKKNNVHHIKGVSDIIGVYHGRPLFIEVKSAKGRLSPEQKQFLVDMKDEGAICGVARSIEDVEQILKDQAIRLETV